MTTITYRDGLMCGDGRETLDTPDESPFVVRDDCVKVWKLPDGSLLGASRSSEDIERLRRSMFKGKKLPKLGDVNAIWVDPKGRIWFTEGKIWVRIDADYYAVGSGSIFALSAMDAGADARLACMIGAKRDPFSGGQITELHLESVSLSRRPKKNVRTLT